MESQDGASFQPHLYLCQKLKSTCMTLVTIDFRVLNMLDMLLLSRNLFYRGENIKTTMAAADDPSVYQVK